MRAPVYGFDHVVDSEGGYGNGGQSFHFYAGLPDGARLRFYLNTPLCEIEIHSHRRKHDRVAQWDQIRGLLGSHDPGDACYRQHISFGGLSLPDQAEGSLAQVDFSPCEGYARGGALSAHF